MVINTEIQIDQSVENKRVWNLIFKWVICNIFIPLNVQELSLKKRQKGFKSHEIVQDFM